MKAILAFVNVSLNVLMSTEFRFFLVLAFLQNIVLNEKLARGEFSCEFVAELIGEVDLISTGSSADNGSITCHIGVKGPTVELWRLYLED